MKMKKSRAILPVLLFIAGLLALGFGTYWILSDSVKSIITESIDEMALHDMQYICDYVDTRWEVMRTLCAELRGEKPETLSVVQDKLNIKTMASGFDHIYLIDGEGSLYSDTYIVYEPSENDYLPYFQGAAEQFVCRHDDKNRYHEFQREYLIYGLNLEDSPLELAGISFVGVVAINDISEIQNKMRITSFGGKGYSSVIDGSGSYIVNLDRASGLNQIPNFYEQLKESRFEDTLSAEEVQEKIAQKESLDFTYTNGEGERRYVSIRPIEDLDWYFVNSVETSVFAAQTFRFSVIIVAVVGLFLLILLAVGGVYFHEHQKLKKFYSSTVEGVYNRQYYDDKLVKERVHAFAVIDIDHLKQINDTCGHLAGDQAIDRLSCVLLLHIGGLGAVCRYGGDEFVIAFTEELSGGAFRERLEMIRLDMEHARLEGFPDASLSVSIGGCYQPGIVGDLFRDADDLLYAAKKKRNIVVTNLEG